MAKTEHYYTKLQPGGIYHVYNRCIDRQALFKTEENHSYFLKRYHKYLSPLLTTYSYALCKNHFHFGVKIKSEADLTKFHELKNYEDRFLTPHDLIAEQFRCFFLSYAKTFNKEHDRVGALFQKPFKRCIVDSEEKFIRMIFYHHKNPQKHKLTSDFRTFRWTSFQRYLMDRPSMLPKEEVFTMMGGRKSFY